MRYRLIFCLTVIPVVLSLLAVSCSSGTPLPESQRLTGESRMNMRSGNTYWRIQEFDRALERYLDVIKDMPDHIEALKRAGDIYFSRAENNPAQASEYYAISYKYYQRAIAAYDEVKTAGNFPDIAEHVKDAELKLRGSWVRLFNMGQRLYEQEQDAEALEEYYKLAELAPDSTQTYIMLATIHQTKGNQEQAMGYFVRIASMNKQDIISRNNLAINYFNNRQYDKALKMYQELAVIDPGNAGFYFNMGNVYLALEKQEEAIAAYEKAYEIDENEVDALMQAATIAYQIDLKERSTLLYEKAYAGYLKMYQEDNSDTYSLVNAANIAFNLGKNEEAVQYYKKALEAEPENNDLYMFLLHSLNRTSRHKEMIEYGIKWFELDITNAEALDFIRLGASRTNDTATYQKYDRILQQLPRK